MITLQFVYLLMGVLTGGVAIVNALDATNPKRWQNTCFWGLYAITFVVGTRLPPLASGSIVIAMVLIASIGGLGQGRAQTTTREERETSARRWGNVLFIPALIVPLGTFLGTVFLKRVTIGGAPLVDVKQITLISLGISTLIALGTGMLILRAPALAPMREARRLLDAVGWAAVLPQMLAALGALFAAAGVGKVVSGLLGQWLPLDVRVVSVIAYTVGMALFTMVMGNAFAAFPVMTAAIGLPLIVQRFGGDPAIMAAVGMLSGFCGTLMTPMAANFNIVPVALLELPDQNAVIKAQIPTGLILLVTNTLLMYFLVFRH
jgi:uncharacterized membrane protein